MLLGGTATTTSNGKLPQSEQMRKSIGPIISINYTILLFDTFLDKLLFNSEPWVVCVSKFASKRIIFISLLLLPCILAPLSLVEKTTHWVESKNATGRIYGGGRELSYILSGEKGYLYHWFSRFDSLEGGSSLKVLKN